MKEPKSPDWSAPMTLRRLVELCGDEYLDVPIAIYVTDPARNHAFVQLKERWPNRALPGGPGDTGRILLEVYIDEFLRKPRTHA